MRSYGSALVDFRCSSASTKSRYSPKPRRPMEMGKRRISSFGEHNLGEAKWIFPLPF